MQWPSTLLVFTTTPSRALLCYRATEKGGRVHLPAAALVIEISGPIHQDTERSAPSTDCSEYQTTTPRDESHEKK